MLTLTLPASQKCVHFINIHMAHEDEWWRQVRDIRSSHGKILSPSDAWLLLRGIRTLDLRVRQSCKSAMAIAKHFESNSKIIELLYPGLDNTLTHDIASKHFGRHSIKN